MAPGKVKITRRMYSNLLRVEETLKFAIQAHLEKNVTTNSILGTVSQKLQGPRTGITGGTFFGDILAHLERNHTQAIQGRLINIPTSVLGATVSALWLHMPERNSHIHVKITIFSAFLPICWPYARALLCCSPCCLIDQNSTHT